MVVNATSAINSLDVHHYHLPEYDLANAFIYTLTRVDKVVDNYHSVVAVQELNNGVRANESSATGDEDSLRHFNTTCCVLNDMI